MQRHIEEHATIEPLSKSRRPTKLSANALQLIENSMRRDDETTAKELVATLRSNRLSVSTTTALKGRRFDGMDTARDSLLPTNPCAEPHQETAMGTSKS